ncbi:MAG TPA: histidine kinase [Cyclobacteriaceae bacterium]|nr:histidine kinase [Cyclobacteriaceae bacterium]
MFAKKRTAYLLFCAAYIGALVVEKPVYHDGSVLECFSYLGTIFTHLFLFGLLILVNNSFLIPNLLEKKFFGAYASALIGLIFLYTFSMNHYNGFIHQSVFHDRVIETSSGFWDNFVYGMCCTVITSMLYVTQKWAEQQEQVKNSRINQLQTELKYLRLQINPHFLFNGLNTVYGSIDMGNSLARNMLVQFSDLLRYNLYEADVDMIAIEKEIKHLRNYVALQKARSNDNIEVTLDIDFPDGTVKVAPLIFMAFVENAFKYASRDDMATSRILISLNQKPGKIDFVCENTYDEGASSPGGIGLTNATRRLELLYKDHYQLDIKNENNVYRVQLTLTL